ncbi:DUF1307 domain-containing protein [Streptococcus sobrinus]|uniref:DUF1307 domain-containing protein n=2 Tax=Streptococcus sobrinus TaxID=1310 RepID=UPI0002FC76A7|nr:DUF1307 domain-containing protein [Streptococcus sobrinus]
MSFRKMFAGLLALLGALLLVACHSAKSNPSQTADYQKLTVGKSDNRIHLVYQDDKVTKVKSTTTELYSAIHADSADAAKQLMEQKGASKYDGIKGVEHKIDYKDDRLVETVMVDCNKVDLNANAAILGLVAPNNAKVNHISFQQSDQSIKSQDYTVIKDGQYQELN